MRVVALVLGGFVGVAAGLTLLVVLFCEVVYRWSRRPSGFRPGRAL